MRANHRCAVVIRQVLSACSRAVRSSRLCGRCAVVQSAFSETIWHSASTFEVIGKAVDELTIIQTAKVNNGPVKNIMDN